MDFIKEETEQNVSLFKVDKKSRQFKRVWTPEEDGLLLEKVKEFNDRTIKWTEVAKSINKSAKQCYSRFRQINPSHNKGFWTKDEEDKLIELIKIHGKKWALISKILKTRSGKQIRHHYINSLDVNNTKKVFTEEEDHKIKELYLKFGPKWQLIGSYFIGRTGDAIKSRYYNKVKYTIENDILKNYFNLKGAKPIFKSDNEIKKEKKSDIQEIDLISNILKSHSIKDENTKFSIPAHDNSFGKVNESISSSSNNAANTNYTKCANNANNDNKDVIMQSFNNENQSIFSTKSIGKIIIFIQNIESQNIFAKTSSISKYDVEMKSAEKLFSNLCNILLLYIFCKLFSTKQE